MTAADAELSAEDKRLMTELGNLIHKVYAAVGATTTVFILRDLAEKIETECGQ